MVLDRVDCYTNLYGCVFIGSPRELMWRLVAPQAFTLGIFGKQLHRTPDLALVNFRWAKVKDKPGTFPCHLHIFPAKE